MRKYIRIVVMSVGLLALTRCELLDPTQGVENPNLTLQSILGTPASTTRWLNGQERQMAILYNGLVTILEIASDNYDNTNTFFNQNFDNLTFDYKDADVNTLLFRVADLRQSAVAGLTQIIPADASATTQQVAEMYFFKGWASLLAGEIFVALPLQPVGAPVTPAESLDAAIADFIEAENLDPANPSYKLALARAYYAKGDKANAVTKANQAIALSANFSRTVKFDGVNALVNTMENALYDRGTFDDLQPLPRLDFLDPKYYGRNASTESPVYIQKIEEAHLIVAEAELSNNNLPAARTAMKNALTIIAARPVETFNDAIEGRTQNSPGSRPNKSTVQVRASDADPFVSGLVLDRTGSVTVPVVSGTSVNATMVDNAATVDALLEVLYLIRQEIFISEGRRFSDLGLRLPISEVEQLLNSNVKTEHIQVTSPSFIPTDMDAITYDAANNQATIKYNMNRVLVQNKTAASVLPFH
jgi:tetratricopeptide (TPR) repeat protein